MTKIIPCSTCGKDIAITAESCPGCGCKNTYVHPRMKSFINKSNTFKVGSTSNIKSTGTVLSCSVAGQQTG